MTPDLAEVMLGEITAALSGTELLELLVRLTRASQQCGERDRGSGLYRAGPVAVMSENDYLAAEAQRALAARLDNVS